MQNISIITFVVSGKCIDVIRLLRLFLWAQPLFLDLYRVSTSEGMQQHRKTASDKLEEGGDCSMLILFGCDRQVNHTEKIASRTIRLPAINIETCSLTTPYTDKTSLPRVRLVYHQRKPSSIWAFSFPENLRKNLTLLKISLLSIL